MFRRSQRLLWASIACLFAFAWGAGQTDAQELPYAQLPAVVKAHVEGTRQICREHDPDLKLSHELTGIDQVVLDRSGTKGIIVRNSEVCHPLNTSGANCSNHSCELTIWKHDRRRGWEKLLQESAHREYVLVENRTSRLKFIVLSLWAGTPQCGKQSDNLIASDICDLLVTYRNGRFVYEKVP